MLLPVFMKLSFFFTFLLSITHPMLGAATKGSGFCPIAQTIKSCLPKCLSDFECMGYKRCCRNVCGSMSCADVNPVSTGNDSRDGKLEGVLCANVKCLPKQKCISENPMKRPRCV